MVNAKLKIVSGDSYGSTSLEIKMNEFLNTIDVRQIIKIETRINEAGYCRAFIYYISLEDIREIKIENVLLK